MMLDLLLELIFQNSYRRGLDIYRHVNNQLDAVFSEKF